MCTYILIYDEYSILVCKQVFDKCFLGSSPSGTVDSVFRGQIAAVYFFKEPQSTSVVSCLYKLGPCYCVSTYIVLLLPYA